jgi:hypothetical protein
MSFEIYMQICAQEDRKNRIAQRQTLERQTRPRIVRGLVKR